MPGQTYEARLLITGNAASAVKAARETQAATEKAAVGTAKATKAAADKSAAAFDSSTTRIGRSFSKLGNLGATFGLPFSNALSAVGTSFDKAETKGKSFSSTISKIGGVELLAAGAGLVIVGASAVRAATDFQTAQARLQTAVQNTGQSFESAQGKIRSLDDRFVKLGFTNADTENSLSRLTASTRDVGEAMRFMGLAADVARARGTDLSDVVDALSKANVGNYRGLRALGVATKEQVANFQNMDQVVAFLSARFGGQAQTFAGTFAGKLAIIKAEANSLEVELGQALIPKIEALAGGTVKSIEAFKSVNKASHGWLGTITALGLGFPVAVFAAEKLASVGGFIAGQYAKVTTSLSASTVAAEEAAVADTQLAAAETEAGVAAGGMATAVAGIGLGLIAGKVAGDQLNHILTGTTPNVDDLTLSLHDLETQTGNIDFGKFAGDLKSQVGSDTINPLKGLKAFTPGAHQAKADIDALEKAFEQLLATEGPQKAQAAFANFSHGIKASGGDINRFNVDMDPFLSKLNLAFAESGKTGGALRGVGDDATATGFAFLGLGDKIKTAAQAMSAIQNLAFGGIKAQIAADTAQQNATDALSALNNPNVGTSGGGGSGQTATAMALDHQQKIEAVTQAQHQLSDAQTSVATTAKAVTDAQKNYDNVINGVSRDTTAARDAQEALTHAQDDAKSSVLDLRDAQRQLAAAIDAQKTAGREAAEALGSASRNAAGAKLDVQDARQALADARLDEDPEEIARAQIALGDAIQRQRDAEESVAQARKDKTDAGKKNSKADDDVKRAQIGVTEASLKNQDAIKAQNDAQRILNGTLHGFPAASKEAQDALQTLTQAQHDARDAIDNTQSSALNLNRAVADLQGKLQNLGAGAGSKLKPLKQRVDDVKSAVIDLATQSAAADKAAGKSFAFQILDQIHILEAYAAASPLLKGAFDDALRTLESKFRAAVVNQYPQLPGLQAKYGVNKSLPGFASGGVVPGPIGKPTIAIVHGGEIVVPHEALARSRPFSGIGGNTLVININAGTLVGNPTEIRKLVRTALQEDTRLNGFVRGVRTE